MVPVISSRAQSQVVPPTTLDRTPFQRVQCGGVVLQEDGIPEGRFGTRPLTNPHRNTAFLRRLSGLRQQLPDDLVAVGRHTDPLTPFHQVDYHLGAHGALARAGRTLDGEIAIVEGWRDPAGSGLRRFSWCQEGLGPQNQRTWAIDAQAGRGPPGTRRGLPCRGPAPTGPGSAGSAAWAQDRRSRTGTRDVAVGTGRPLPSLMSITPWSSSRKKTVPTALRVSGSWAGCRL